MKRRIIFIVIFSAVILYVVFLCVNSLTFKIYKTIWGKDCTASAAVIYDDKIWTYNNEKFPLLSVFKYFIAVSVLKKLEIERKVLNDTILVLESMVNKNMYSPMLKKHKKFPFKITIAELMEYMISESDNNAADILIEYVGGISVIKNDLAASGFNDIEIFANEKMMNFNIENEYLNKAAPLDVLSYMKALRQGQNILLTKENKKFLDRIMIKAVTGENKIKAGLSKNVIFGHKTGSSSRKPDGVKIADNDAGFAILPDGSVCYIAVFITESKMTDNENAALISKISNLIYKYITTERIISFTDVLPIRLYE